MEQLLENELYKRKLLLETEIKEKEGNLSAIKKNIIEYQQVQDQESKLYAIEEKFNGFRATIHKKGGMVKIYSDQAKDITFPFPTIEEQAKNLSEKDFIIDCELVPFENNKPVGRDIAARYIGAVKSKKQISDKNVIFYAFDCLYFGKDITDLPWFERKKALHSLQYSDNIKEVGSVIVDNKEDAIKAMTTLSKIKGSEGVIIKKYYGKYFIGKENDVWIKYRKLLEVDVISYKVNVVTGTNANNYSVGILLPIAELSKIQEKYVLEIGDKKILDLGNTFNTSIKAQTGDYLV